MRGNSSLVALPDSADNHHLDIAIRGAAHCQVHLLSRGRAWRLYWSRCQSFLRCIITELGACIPVWTFDVLSHDQYFWVFCSRSTGILSLSHGSCIALWFARYIMRVILLLKLKRQTNERHLLSLFSLTFASFSTLFPYPGNTSSKNVY
jgi:hypothetical protein